MKAVEITEKVNLKNGLSITSGSVVVVNEAYANIKNTKNGLIPCQIITQVYASKEIYKSGKMPVEQIADFNPCFYGLQLSVSDYETISTENLLIEVVRKHLEILYPGKINIINL